MDYIDGEDLGQMLQRRNGQPFDLREVLPWAQQLLEILQFIHTRTFPNIHVPVVHRDVKPSNIKLRANGQIVLVDFGLARFEKTQILAATWQYAPPEQLNGGSPDQRGDLFAVAATLHHLLTGKHPDEEVRAGKKSPHQINPQLPLELSQLLMRAMAQNPDDRPSSAQAMLNELNQITDTERRHTTRVGFMAQVAKAYVQQEDWSRALQIYAELVQIDPANPQWSEARLHAEQQQHLKHDYDEGIRALKAGDPTRAKDAFTRVIRVDSNYKDAVEKLAEAKRMERKRQK
jgi:serine/threonine protein kinase